MLRDPQNRGARMRACSASPAEGIASQHTSLLPIQAQFLNSECSIVCVARIVELGSCGFYALSLCSSAVFVPE